MASSKGLLRSSCPVGFEPVNLDETGHCPTEEDFKKSKSNSLWLIKVPHDFDVSSLDGQNVVLNGCQDLPSITDQGTTKRYEIHSRVDSTSQLASFSLLLPSSQENSMYSSVGGFNGQMNVVQSLAVPPSLLPESPPMVSREPSCQVARKWKPFGYKNPRTNPSRVGDEIEKKSEKRKKKKKERKNRREGNVNTPGKECDTSALQLDRTKHHGLEQREEKKSQNGFHPDRVRTEPTSCGEVEKNYDEKSACSSKTRKRENDEHSERVLVVSKHKVESKTNHVGESESPRKRLRKHKSGGDFGETSPVKIKQTNGVDDFSLVKIKTAAKDVPSVCKKKHKK